MNDSIDKECTVCFSEVWLTKTICNHKICVECLFKLKKDECPICRRTIYDTLPRYLQQFMSCLEKSERRLDIESLQQFPTLS